MKYYRQLKYLFAVGMRHVVFGDDGGAYIKADESTVVPGAKEITQAEFEAMAKSREPAPEDETAPAPQESPANSMDTSGLAAAR